MHDPQWFWQMEQDYNEREDYRAQVAYERQQLESARKVVFVCPYCTKEINEHAACCGEIGRAVPMMEGEDE